MLCFWLFPKSCVSRAKMWQTMLGKSIFCNFTFVPDKTPSAQRMWQSERISTMSSSRSSLYFIFLSESMSSSFLSVFRMSSRSKIYGFWGLNMVRLGERNMLWRGSLVYRYYPSGIPYKPEVVLIYPKDALAVDFCLSIAPGFHFAPIRRLLITCLSGVY